MQDYIQKLKRRLVRLKGTESELRDKHAGNEHKYTYHGGWDLGYVQGKIHEIEEIIDKLEAHSTYTE